MLLVPVTRMIELMTGYRKQDRLIEKLHIQSLVVPLSTVTA